MIEASGTSRDCSISAVFLSGHGAWATLSQHLWHERNQSGHGPNRRGSKTSHTISSNSKASFPRWRISDGMGFRTWTVPRRGSSFSFEISLNALSARSRRNIKAIDKSSWQSGRRLNMQSPSRSSSNSLLRLKRKSLSFRGANPLQPKLHHLSRLRHLLHR